MSVKDAMQEPALPEEQAWKEVDEMRTEHASASSELACFEQFEALRMELSNAISTIAGNSVQGLEESLWKQQVLCTSVKRLLEGFQRSPMKASTLKQLQCSMEALVAVNRTYADVIAQSNASSSLLYGLCCSYKNQGSRQQDGTGSSCSLEA